MTKRPTHVLLYPREIVCDPERNSRKEYPERAPAEQPGQQLSTAQLDLAISERGVLQPPMVRNIEGAWYAVFGYRRIASAQRVRPNQKLKCPILYQRGDEIDQEIGARFVNLQENLQREDLKPWEIAEAIYQIAELRPTITMVEVSTQLGLTPGYVANLYRLRTKAHPDIWAQFQRWGVSLKIPYKEMLAIAILPKDEQLAAWNKAIESRQSRVGKRGKEQKPGPAKLRRMLASVDTIRDKSSEFRRGLRLGLGIALGENSWPEPMPAEQSNKGKSPLTNRKHRNSNGQGQAKQDG